MKRRRVAPPRLIARDATRRGLIRKHAYDGWSERNRAWEQMNHLEKMLRALAGDGACGNRVGPLRTPKASRGAPDPGLAGES